MLLRLVLSLSSIVAATSMSNASSISECNAALVVESYSQYDHDILNVSMIKSIDQDTWNKASSKFGASANLFGVPINVSYDAYKDSGSSYTSEDSTQLSSEAIGSVVRVGLDGNSVAAYRACLETISDLNGTGLKITDVKETANVMSVVFRWREVGVNAAPLPLTWTTIDPEIFISGADAMAEMPVGEEEFQFRRPREQEQLVSVNADGRRANFIVAPEVPKCTSDCGRKGTCGISNPTGASFIAGSPARLVCENMAAGKYYLNGSFVFTFPQPPGVGAQVNLNVVDSQGVSHPVTSNTCVAVLVGYPHNGQCPDTLSVSNHPIEVTGGDVRIEISTPAPFADAMYGQVVNLPLSISPSSYLSLTPRQ